MSVETDMDFIPIKEDDSGRDASQPVNIQAPTQSNTNGEKADTTDENVSVMEKGSNNWEISRSREMFQERENKRHDRLQEVHERSHGATLPQSRNAKKQPVPRRHTLQSSRSADQDKKNSKEALMDVLAARYPQYAEKISSTTSEDGFPVGGRSRNPRRRATVGVGHSLSLSYEGQTTSEMDGPTFQRGGFVRSSLPVTRSASSSVGKASGSIFLIFRDETRRALLPDEITHLDTVRAMFVRSFPGKLALPYLESPKRKIYILDPCTHVYYQLEDLRDIKEGTVLKVHHCHSMEPQKILDKPEVRGRSVQQIHKAQTLPRYTHHPIYMSHDGVSQSLVVPTYERSRSLTPDRSTSALYAQNPIYGYMGMPVGRETPIHKEMIDRHLHLYGLHKDYTDIYPPSSVAPSSSSPMSSQWPHTRQAMSPPAVPFGSKDTGRMTFSPPANLNSYDQTQVVSGNTDLQGPQHGAVLVNSMRTQPAIYPQQVSAATHVVPAQAASTPGHSSHVQQSWHKRSPVCGWSQPLSTVNHGGPSAAQQHSQNYRVPATSEWIQSLVARPSSSTPSAVDMADSGTTKDRIDKMEHQLANLAAWVQTAAIQLGGSAGAPSRAPSISSEMCPLLDSASSSLTNIASHTPALSLDLKDYLQVIKQQANTLRTDLRSLRHLQQINKQCIIETVEEAWKKIKNALSSVPGADNLLIHQQQNRVDILYNVYLQDKNHVEQELADLEIAVEELRSDAFSRQCHVQVSDVEGMTLVLTNVTKQLGDLKDRFLKLQDQLKYVMSAEMELIAKEEKFLNEEPERLDKSLNKCKKLTGTLVTLKGLASVQECRPPQPVSPSAQAKIPTQEDKMALLQNIEAVVPNHEVRSQKIQVADTAKLIKKKVTAQQESFRSGNNTEIAGKVLKPHDAAIRQSGQGTSGLTTTFQTSGLASTSTSHTSGVASTSQTAPVTSGSTRTTQTAPVTSELTSTTQTVPVTLTYVLARRSPTTLATSGVASTSQTAPVTSGLISTTQTVPLTLTFALARRSPTAPAPSGVASTSQTWPLVSGCFPYTSAITISSSPSRTESAMSAAAAVISLALPISKSSPNSASQYSVSQQEKSATSLSMSYPIMSVSQESSPKRLLSCGQSDCQKLKSGANIGQGINQNGNDYEFTSGQIGKGVESQPEPAMLPGTGNETIEQTLTCTKSDNHSTKTNNVDLNNQKIAARAAFFSSLSSPPTSTAIVSTTTSVLLSESPTESFSSKSSNVCVSPLGGGISALTRNSAALFSCSSTNTSMTLSQVLSTLGKPSSLPVTNTSLLSKHRFSSPSPSNGAQPSSRLQTAFTVIPKPHSPTKSTPSPITPDSPKYQISFCHQHTSGISSNRAGNIIQSRETSDRPKKIPPLLPPRKISKLPGHAVQEVSAEKVNGQLPKPKDTESCQVPDCKDFQNIKS